VRVRGSELQSKSRTHSGVMARPPWILDPF
jgi:hypothetical protein